MWRKKYFPTISELPIEDKEIQAFINQLARETVMSPSAQPGETIKLRDVNPSNTIWVWVGNDRFRLLSVQREVIELLHSGGYHVTPSPEEGLITWVS